MISLYRGAFCDFGPHIYITRIFSGQPVGIFIKTEPINQEVGREREREVHDYESIEKVWQPRIVDSRLEKEQEWKDE